ncbi:MAG: DegT/DnrJ/EryC1/StrS aminotransferase family protein [Proteobacteria bacterium]|nr:DegT/DnrJ/EryC1/StrS aminotransferase family protein [Pseudomonadota bacterium]
MTQAPSSDPNLASWPFYGADEIRAVTDVLASGRVNYWTGDLGRTFENAYAAHCGVRFGLGVANGTVAIELALYGLDIGPGDDVVVPARTFIATAAAVATRGARPVVADVDPVSQNMTAATLAAALTPRTKAVIPVHLAGWPVDMGPLLDLAKSKNIAVIEDVAQAHGASVNGKPVGGLGQIGCFSFCQDKIISTGGEGGMVVTDDEAMYQRMWSFRDHGKNFAVTHDPNAGGHGAFKWVADSFGTNWRLTEAQAAIGLAQLAKLQDWIARRRANAGMLDEALQGLNSVTVPRVPAHLTHAYYKYYFFVDPAALKDGWTRDRICNELIARGIPARVGACPDITREKAFADMGPQPAHPGAASIEDRTVLLPVHPTLSPGNMKFMATTLRAVVGDATR